MSPTTLRWVDRAGRFGFVAKGVVYAIVGGYALKVALGRGGAFLDKEAVARKVELQAYGQVLLAILGAGLACYAAWRLVQAIVDPRGENRDGMGIAKRIGSAGSAAVHGLLALTVFQTLAGDGHGRGTWLARVIAKPGGKWLVIAIGLVMIGSGVYQLVRAYRASFARDLSQSEMSPAERTWARRVGRYGLVARGIVFPIAGWFFVKAGLETDASQAKGTGAALRAIWRAPFGNTLLLLVATGLIAYAVLMVLEARYRRPYA